MAGFVISLFTITTCQHSITTQLESLVDSSSWYHWGAEVQVSRYHNTPPSCYTHSTLHSTLAWDRRDPEVQMQGLWSLGTESVTAAHSRVSQPGTGPTDQQRQQSSGIRKWRQGFPADSPIAEMRVQQTPRHDVTITNDIFYYDSPC